MNLSIGDPIFFGRISTTRPFEQFIAANDLYEKASPEGKFYLNVKKKLSGLTLQSRYGEWSNLFPVQTMPGLVMPEYDPIFSKTFEEVTDQRALDVKKILNETDRNVILYYSGGFDSTICLVALMRNLTEAELKRIHLGMSLHSVIESPQFFKQFIAGKFKIIDTTNGNTRYNDVIDQGNYLITADNGDCLFGTEAATQLYYSYEHIANKLNYGSLTKLNQLMNRVSDAAMHYSNYSDIIIGYYDLDDVRGFGQELYERLDRNIKSSQIPVQSLHDFFWWFIFNPKCVHCYTRGSLIFGDYTNYQESFEKFVINWYQTDDYQRWSMVNNNNGQKIMGVTANTYKWAARKYIYDFTKDDWYLNFKLKIKSLHRLKPRGNERHNVDNIENRFAIDTNYNLVSLNDPGVKEYIEHYLTRSN